MNYKSVLLLIKIIFIFTSVGRSQSFSTLGPGFDQLSDVRTVFLDTTSNLLYAGGSFNATSNGIPLYKISVWNGLIWDSLNSGANGYVNSILKYDNYIYAGGSFSQMGNVVAEGLAKWDGTNWYSAASFLSAFQFPSVVRLKCLNNDLYVMGGFVTVDSVPVNL